MRNIQVVLYIGLLLIILSPAYDTDIWFSIGNIYYVPMTIIDR